jgi:group I intron endonuclease
MNSKHPNEPGIYAIIHKESGKRYVGSSVNIKHRFKVHRRMLSKGNHPNIHLQRAWIKNGKQAFMFVIIELCKPSELIAREQFHIDIKADYNIVPNAYKPPTFKGLTHSPETRAKMSAAQSGERHAMFGKHHTAEAKEKIRKSSTGRRHTPDELAKMGEKLKGKQPFLGLSHSQKTREKMRLSALKLWANRHASGAVIDARAERERKRLMIMAKEPSELTQAERGSARAYKAWETKRAKENVSCTL